MGVRWRILISPAAGPCGALAPEQSGVVSEWLAWGGLRWGGWSGMGWDWAAIEVG